MNGHAKPRDALSLPVTRRRACALVGALSLAALVPALGACSSGRDAASDVNEKWSQSLTEDDVRKAARQANVNVSDVAAVVVGTVITWRDVDARIQQDRIRQGVATDATMSSASDDTGLTKGSERARALKALIDDALISTDAERRDIDVDDEGIDQEIDDLAARYPSHGAFVDALEAAGYTEDSYRAAVRASAISQSLRAAVAPSTEPTDEQVREYAVVMAPTLAGRRSSQILLAQGDYALAHELRARAVAGEDFAEMARSYSIDGSAENGGDMGWDCLNHLSDEYQQALDRLEPGEVSPVVRSQFGYHIIKCTDRYEPTYDANGDVDISAMPADLLASLKSSMNDALVEQAYARYVESLEATAALAVFDEDGTWIDPAQIGLATEVPPETDVSASALMDLSAVRDASERGDGA